MKTKQPLQSESRSTEAMPSLADVLLPHLQAIYSEDAERILADLLALIGKHQPKGFQAIEARWDDLRMIKQVGRCAGVETFPSAVY